jgi:hypothetical protein
MLEIDHEQHDHRARKQQPRHEHRGRFEQEVRTEEHRAGDELDDRILNRNRRAAVPAPATQPEVTKNRDVVVRFYRLVAVRAMRAGPHQRFAQGQAINADVQKAADSRPEHHDEDRGRDVHRGTGDA